MCFCKWEFGTNNLMLRSGFNCFVHNVFIEEVLVDKTTIVCNKNTACWLLLLIHLMLYEWLQFFFFYRINVDILSLCIIIFKHLNLNSYFYFKHLLTYKLLYYFFKLSNCHDTIRYIHSPEYMKRFSAISSKNCVYVSAQCSVNTK